MGTHPDALNRDKFQNVDERRDHNYLYGRNKLNACRFNEKTFYPLRDNTPENKVSADNCSTVFRIKDSNANNCFRIDQQLGHATKSFEKLNSKRPKKTHW